MDKNEFLKVFNNKAYNNFYVLDGDENYLKKLALDFALSKIINKNFQDVDINYFKNPDVESLLTAALARPMASEHRAIVVNGSSLFSGTGTVEKEDSERFIQFINDIPKYTVLFILVDGNCDGRKPVTKACKDYIVNFSYLSGDDCIKWIINEVSRNSKTISFINAQKLQLAVGCDSANLKSEISKLISFIDERQTIEGEDIDRICFHSINYTVFNMTEALLLGNIKLALSMEHKLLLNGENEYTLFVMLLRECRLSYYIKALSNEKKTIVEISRLSSIPPFAVDKKLRALNKLNLNTIFNAYEYCINTDFEIKSGKISQQGICQRTILGIYNILNLL